MNQAATEFEEEAYSLLDYVAMVKRRKTPLVLTVAGISILALLLAFLLPAKYTSQATILIEEQEVPREFVISTITSYAAQQIQVISQRVLTAETIAEIADKFGLFVDPSTNSRPPATETANEFRETMTLELVSADVIDPRSGRPQEATIAFTLAFDHENPSTAQKVTSELVTLFLDENLRNRTERVASTEAFLSAQANSLNEELARIEADIAEIKKKDGPALPEMFQYNVGTLDRTSAEISDIDRRLRELSRNRIELTAELGMTNPSGARTATTGENLMSLREQLAALRREYQQKSARFQKEHPDMLAVERQIYKLEADLVSGRSTRASGAASNPNFIILKTRLDAVDGEITSLKEKQRELAAKADRFQELISRAPSVEVAYNAKLREFNTTQQKYQDVRAKQREAQLSENMEQERKGERFVMVEPPDLPLSPSSPNRPVIALVGLLLALGAGFGLVLLLEAIDNGIHDERTLRRLTGVPPFATVGYIETQAERKQASSWRKRLVQLAVVALLCSLVLIHFLVKPLDVVWFMTLNRLGI